MNGTWIVVPGIIIPGCQQNSARESKNAARSAPPSTSGWLSAARPRLNGPIPMPTRIEKFTVNRSPHIDKKWHLAKDDKTRGWLKEQMDAGRGLILNGFDQPVQGRRSEFASLGEHEARLRLKGATRQMSALGFDLDMFAPPRWRMSDGTLKVLDEFGFTVAASTKGIYRIKRGEFSQARNL